MEKRIKVDIKIDEPVLLKDCYKVISKFIPNRYWINFISTCKDFLSFNTKEEIILRKRCINHLMKLIELYPNENWDVDKLLKNPLFELESLDFESDLYKRCLKSKYIGYKLDLEDLIDESLCLDYCYFNPMINLEYIITMACHTPEFSGIPFRTVINSPKIYKVISPMVVNHILKNGSMYFLDISFKIKDNMSVNYLLSNPYVLNNIKYIEIIMKRFNFNEPHYYLSKNINLDLNLDSIETLISHPKGLALNKTLNEKYINKILSLIDRNNSTKVLKYLLSNYRCKLGVRKIIDILRYGFPVLILTSHEALNSGVIDLTQINENLQGNLISYNSALSWDIIKKNFDLGIWNFKILSKNTFGNLYI